MRKNDDENGRHAGEPLISFYRGKPKKLTHQSGIKQLPLGEANGFRIDAAAIAHVVYVPHPVDHSRLIPFGDYDEVLARDRLTEVLRVFTRLGAARIVATSSRVETKATGFRPIFGQSSPKLDHGKESALNLEVDQRGSGGPARDPRPLKYDDIPGLDSACEAVFNNGGSSFNIAIEQSMQYSFDSELGISLRKAGFKLGASHSRTRSNTFLVRVRMGEDASHELDQIVNATAEDIQVGKRQARTTKSR